MSAVTAPEPGPVSHRSRLASFVEGERVQRLVVALIVINAITLGLETWPAAMAAAGGWLLAIDRAILAVFVVELALKLYALGLRFWRNPWNVFDFVIVGIALLPATGALSVLRAFRVLRLLRLVSVVPRMRFIVESVIGALPGLGTVVLLLVLVFYVFAVMATKLFGADFPQWFGSLGGTMFTLFQIMTLEGWAEIARATMERYAFAWAFFLAFILVGTFTVLNLFIGIIVNAMQAQHEANVREGREPEDATVVELRRLREEISELRATLGRSPDAQASSPPARRE
ncbi:MAG: ion transporter [Pseudomonadota bacterium]